MNVTLLSHQILLALPNFSPSFQPLAKADISGAFYVLSIIAERSKEMLVTEQKLCLNQKLSSCRHESFFNLYL